VRVLVRAKNFAARKVFFNLARKRSPSVASFPLCRLPAACGNRARFRARFRIVREAGMTGASRSKSARFFRRGRPEHRVYRIEVPFTEDELALVEREAATHGLSIDDYIIMRALEEGEVKGNA
jgi:hypothetical protein